MNFNRRSGTIAAFITLGVLLTGVAITLNISWILLNRARLAYVILGIVLFAVLVAGVVLNTVFLVREVKRNERQDSFLNAVTHELKTPIASIRLYLDTLERRQLDEEQRRKFYAIMKGDSDRLLATVEQVLKAGELGQRQRHLNRQRIELEPLLAECIAITLSRHHLPAESIVQQPVAGAVQLSVSGIAQDLRTAFLNLIENAVKYSPNGVSIRIRLEIVEYAKVAISVTDQGIGIPERELKRIFKRFYRIPGKYEVRIKGTGLGLFLVRTIMKQHGGSISAASKGPNQGTTMTVTLPLA